VLGTFTDGGGEGLANRRQSVAIGHSVTLAASCPHLPRKQGVSDQVRNRNLFLERTKKKKFENCTWGGLSRGD